MSNSHDEPGHGSSPAAWTTVLIILFATTIGTVFFWFDMPEAVFASAGLAALGVVAGLVMKKAGYGVGGKHTKTH